MPVEVETFLSFGRIMACRINWFQQVQSTDPASFAIELLCSYSVRGVYYNRRIDVVIKQQWVTVVLPHVGTNSNRGVGIGSSLLLICYLP